MALPLTMTQAGRHHEHTRRVTIRLESRVECGVRTAALACQYDYQHDDDEMAEVDVGGRRCAAGGGMRAARLQRRPRRTSQRWLPTWGR